MRRAILNVGALCATMFLIATQSAAQEWFGIVTGPSHNTATGKVMEGLALSLTPDNLIRPLGAPIWVTVELQNQSNEPIQLHSTYLGYSFTIVNTRAAQVLPRNRALSPASFGAIEGPLDIHRLAPHSSAFARFRLDTSYRFTQPGFYRVFVSSFLSYSDVNVSLQSNQITLTIPPQRTREHTAPAPVQSPTFEIWLQTDRPAYVLGQPIFLRLIMRNISNYAVERETGWAGELASIIMLNGRGDPVGAPVAGATDGRAEMPLPFAPHTTLVLGYLDNDWVGLQRWGYNAPPTGSYILAAFSNYESSSSSAPVRVKVLSNAAAMAQPSTTLDDPSLSGSIESLLGWYHGVLVRTAEMIGQVPTSSHVADLYFKFGSAWGDSGDQQKFADRLKKLPMGNPGSRYANVTANLMESLRHLASATSSAIQIVGVSAAVCDEAKAMGEVRVAEYYYDAVSSEIGRGSASIADAATPPAVRSSPHKCPW